MTTISYLFLSHNYSLGIGTIISKRVRIKNDNIIQIPLFSSAFLFHI